MSSIDVFLSCKLPINQIHYALLGLFPVDPQRATTVYADADQPLREGLEMVCYIERFEVGEFPLGLTIFVDDSFDPPDWFDLSGELALRTGCPLISYIGYDPDNPFLAYLLTNPDTYQIVLIDEILFSDEDRPGIEIEEYLE